MTFGVPYSFVPGTKAKADEVNANFIDVLTKIENTNLRIDETNSNADSKNTEFATQFEEVESTLAKRANLDLSNLSTTGKAVLSAKANAADIDGKWVAKTLVLASNVKLANSGTITYSLSGYLPTDSNIYEVVLSCAGYFDKGQYNFNTGYGLMQGPYMVGKQVFGIFTLPVSTARNLILTPTTICSGDNQLSLRLSAYRKVR